MRETSPLGQKKKEKINIKYKKGGGGGHQGQNKFKRKIFFLVFQEAARVLALLSTRDVFPLHPEANTSMRVQFLIADLLYGKNKDDLFA